jgi:hypothetical protein
MRIKVEDSEIEVSTEELKDPEVRKWVNNFVELLR